MDFQNSKDFDSQFKDFVNKSTDPQANEPVSLVQRLELVDKFWDMKEFGESRGGVVWVQGKPLSPSSSSTDYSLDPDPSLTMCSLT